jgi:hypothetical protein
MNAFQLIAKSKVMLAEQDSRMRVKPTVEVFSHGANWMRFQLNALGQRQLDTTEKIRFNYFGILKYGICIFAFFLSATLLMQLDKLLIPLAILFFYFAEVHFVFLFPLLLDGCNNPLLTSIRQTYKIGIFYAMLIVIPLSVYMLAGLFNVKDPFKNWHEGALAIIIWYQDEIRDRIQQ